MSGRASAVRLRAYAAAPAVAAWQCDNPHGQLEWINIRENADLMGFNGIHWGLPSGKLTVCL